MPSLWEGLPLSLVLAMGAGLPVVATRSPAFPRSSTTARPGLLVPPGDAAGARRALARVVADPAFGRRLGGAARDVVLPRFGVDGYVAVGDRALRPPARASARA